MIKLAKKELSPYQQQLKMLKEDLNECRKEMKRVEMLFSLTTDENLIEARIYQMKSLVKHHDYITATIRRLMEKEKTPENTTENIQVKI